MLNTTLLFKEMKQGLLQFAIWTLCIVFMLMVCVFIYPEMAKDAEMIEEMNQMFADMGEFSKAFGMDTLNMGDIVGYYAVECGSTLGIGGGLFAALIGIGALSSEEKNKTAEFLLAHPISRTKIISSKYIAVLLQVFMLNLAVVGGCLGASLVIGEDLMCKEFFLIHLANLLLQIEIASICFAISAFQRKSNIGLGIGLALGMYFLNIICNMYEDAKLIKYITPYAYTEASKIVENQSLDTKLVVAGMVVALAFVVVAYIKYSKKDIYC